ncbi:MAG TPA: ECF-type sigma factor [Gemmataceae bacterium]|jgi:hypothetical protein|nr:ECF-type sigma factor [Gemmataceae bacterium]
MNDITRILSAIDASDPQASERLLPLVYEELRQLAAHKLAQEAPGQTLQATALVHEAYLRLVGQDQSQSYTTIFSDEPWPDNMKKEEVHKALPLFLHRSSKTPVNLIRLSQAARQRCYTHAHLQAWAV